MRRAPVARHAAYGQTLNVSGSVRSAACPRQRLSWRSWRATTRGRRAHLRWWRAGRVCTNSGTNVRFVE